MPTSQDLIERRARQRARRRRRRIIGAVLAVALIAVVCVAGAMALQRMGRRPSQPQTAATTGPRPSVAATAKTTADLSASPEAHPTKTASPSAKATPSKSPTPAATSVVGAAAPRPPITQDYIDFNSTRRAEMAAYALTHYGSSNVHFVPKVIVLHYTCGSSYENAHATFQSDAPNMGVKPGVVSQFVIDKDGTIYQQIPLTSMGRHTVGLNYVAFGIECVQECPSGSSDAQTVGAIMHRPAQEKSLVALVRWLMYRYHISLSNVIGHGTANGSPYYRDLKGWKNDHTDWSKPQVQMLRARLK